MTEETRWVPVPLTPDDLTVLAWYADWTPDVHRALWQHRRQWPPGYRTMSDMSAPSAGRAGGKSSRQHAEDGQSLPPLLTGERRSESGYRKKARGLVSRLLEFRLIEGHRHIACRLTARGRAALKLNGMDCPDSFESHCSQIFDDHSLLPVMGENVKTTHRDHNKLRELYGAKQGEPLPDVEAIWRFMLQEYTDRDFGAHYSNESGTARLSTVSGRRWLHNSFRPHDSWLSLTIEDSHRSVCEIAMSFEQLAALLTTRSSTPVTLVHYRNREGMPAEVPVAPPKSIRKRMEKRVMRSMQDHIDRIAKVIEKLDGARMPKGVRNEVKHTLGVVSSQLASSGTFAAEQAAEEISIVGESIMTIMHERATAIAAEEGGLTIGGRRLSGQLLLDQGEETEKSEQST